MTGVKRNRFAEEAEHAVGSALLYWESPNGGSSGGSIDKNRAQRIAANLTGPELLKLLHDTANRAVERAESEANFTRALFVEQVEMLAERTDSLAMHRFIQRYKEDNK